MASAQLELTGDQTVLGLIAIVVLPLLTLVGWFFALRDLIRRDDAGTTTKVVWGVAVIVFGIVGVVLYFLFRPRGATAGERAAEQQRSDEFVAKYSQPTQPPGPDSGDENRPT